MGIKENGDLKALFALGGIVACVAGTGFLVAAALTANGELEPLVWAVCALGCFALAAIL